MAEQVTLEITIKAAIIKDGNKVLIVRRSKTNDLNPGKYDLPGGHIEIGEDFEEALEREINEEVKIKVDIGTIISATSFRENKKGLRYIVFYKSGEVKLSKAHDKYEWLEIDKAIKKLSDEGFEAEKKETLKKAKEYLEMKNALTGWQRAIADFDNYKKQQVESQKEFTKFAAENIIHQILPVLDNFHASTDHIPKDQQNSPWVQGIMHIQKQLEDVLRDNRVEEIKVNPGDSFNPEIHEAVKSDSNDANPPAGGHLNDSNKHKIIKIVKKGYRMNGKVVRVVRVAVA